MNNQRIIRMAMMMLMRPIMNLLMRVDTNDTSPDGKARQARANQMTKGTKQAMRLTRRMSKF